MRSDVHLKLTATKVCLVIKLSFFQYDILLCLQFSLIITYSGFICNFKISFYNISNITKYYGRSLLNLIFYSFPFPLSVTVLTERNFITALTSFLLIHFFYNIFPRYCANIFKCHSLKIIRIKRIIVTYFFYFHAGQKVRKYFGQRRLSSHTKHSCYAVIFLPADKHHKYLVLNFR